MPCDTEISELDRLAASRWSIEQCFQERKSYLGMSHYETRSYQAWHRHMLLVMIAQLFITVLRVFLKKRINVTMPMARCIAASLIPAPSRMIQVLAIIHYRLRRNAAAFRSHFKKSLLKF